MTGIDIITGPPRPQAQQRAVVCIGVFDGVHRGHRWLIAQARAAADRAGLPLVVMTFQPHPRSVVQPAQRRSPTPNSRQLPLRHWFASTARRSMTGFPDSRTTLLHTDGAWPLAFVIAPLNMSLYAFGKLSGILRKHLLTIFSFAHPFGVFGSLAPGVHFSKLLTQSQYVSTLRPRFTSTST